MSSKPGEKHDTGKARWDLLPFVALEQVARVLTFGADKYAPEGWRTVPDWRDRYLAATLRHVAAWKGRAALDPESGLPHLAHAACCLLFMAELDGSLMVLNKTYYCRLRWTGKAKKVKKGGVK